MKSNIFPFSVSLTLILLTTISIGLNWFIDKSAEKYDAYVTTGPQNTNKTAKTPTWLLRMLLRGDKSIIIDSMSCNKKDLKDVVVLIQAFQTNEEDSKLRRKVNSLIFNTLVQHFKDTPEALVYLRRSFDNQTAGQIFKDFNYKATFFQRISDTLNYKYHRARGFKIHDRLLGIGLDLAIKLKDVAKSYLDLLMDSFLLVLLMSLAKDEFDSFSFQIILILFLSIIVPLFVSGCTTAYKRPLAPFGYGPWKRLSELNSVSLIMIRVLVVIFYPLVPSLVICSKRKAEKEKTALSDMCCKLAKQGKEDIDGLIVAISHLEKYLKELKSAQLTFKRNELSMEIVIQLSIHTTMVLLTNTLHPLESGLQSVFQVVLLPWCPIKMRAAYLLSPSFIT